MTNLQAAFPDFTAEIDDVYYNGNAQDGYRVAVRWNFSGTHRGYSTYGPPTGKPVRSIVATEFRVKGEKIVEEWTLFNELALLWQMRYR